MKVKSGFMMRNIMDEYILVPVGENSLKFSALISTNDVGARIWECLQEDTTREAIIEKLYEEYEVDRQLLETDVDRYLNRMREIGMLLE